MSTEVLIYVQNMKKYFTDFPEVREYFIGNSDEDLFFKHLIEISQKNFEKDGDPMLKIEQFELLKLTISAITISKKEINELENDKIFIQTSFFGKICLN
jgi:hypothetical protein